MQISVAEASVAGDEAVLDFWFRYRVAARGMISEQRRKACDWGSTTRGPLALLLLAEVVEEPGMVDAAFGDDLGTGLADFGHDRAILHSDSAIIFSGLQIKRYHEVGIAIPSGGGHSPWASGEWGA